MLSKREVTERFNQVADLLESQFKKLPQIDAIFRQDGELTKLLDQVAAYKQVFNDIKNKGLGNNATEAQKSLYAQQIVYDNAVNLVEARLNYLKEQTKELNDYSGQITRLIEKLNELLSKADSMKNDLLRQQCAACRNYIAEIPTGNYLESQDSNKPFLEKLPRATGRAKEDIDILNFMITNLDKSIERETLATNIREIYETFAAEQKKILNLFKAQNLILTPSEKKDVERFFREAYTIMERDKAVDLSAEYELALQRKEHFAKDSEVVQGIVDRHLEAKKMLNVERLIEQVNANKNQKDATMLLKTAANYDVGFYQKIESNLWKFKLEGLSTIKSFLQESDHKQLPIVKNIQDKIPFVEYKKENQLSGKSNENLKALKQLYANNFVITEDLLKNPFLSRGLAVLKELNIPLTEEIVTKLLTNPEKCNIIYYQNKRNQELIPPIVLNEDLVNQLLQVSDKTAKILATSLYADNNYDQTKDLCHPQLFIAAVQNPESSLFTILDSTENLSWNIPFLRSLLNANDILAGDEAFNKSINALYCANLDPESYNLAQSAQVMERILVFNDDYQKIEDKPQKNKIEMQQFPRIAVDALLTEKSLVEKKKDVIDSAKFTHRDKGVRLLADFLQCITFAFLVIMPIRYFHKDTHPTFSGADTARLKELKLQLAEIKDEAPEEEQEPDNGPNNLGNS